LKYFSIGKGNVNIEENLIENINKKDEIGDYFKFMEENISKEKDKFISERNLKSINSESNSKLNDLNDLNSYTDKHDDINELLKLVKCPISDEKLIEDEEGLKYEVNYFYSFYYFIDILSL
jgi:hypothetical protein